ncbi:uncharacterized protein EV422DRAFT_408032 [Fimicolochytrium jonesii]|uniref:uncharacterized protein n=1 Tax=Fimicolochytrium jonesii TaxID=1396493 RepID=UPI0022FE808A|nr:uncharacterized protein EV422DRAFT_408032 [Fimicolochytrium jonesii]KAI8822636.1 hypothetical protein EV422DRAFT_408032 [Fimicolochytrium jonesii]
MMKATAASYTHVAMSILKRLRARQPATCDEDVGIDGEYVPIADKKPVGVPLAGLEKLMASEDQLRLMGYPFPAEQRTETPPGNGSKGENLADPDRKRCSRCGKNFVPKWPLEHLEWEECNYHWGFKRVVVQSGVKEAIWSCCQSPVHLQGACTKGPHVFAEDDTAQLDARIPFQTLPENSPDSKKVVALDCEMSYTVGGMELTRVTVVDYGGESLLDELVRTKFPVLDLNTKWSGVTSLDDAKYDLAGIQVELGKIMDRNTIMIGHGLENDLNAMRVRTWSVCMVVASSRQLNALVSHLQLYHSKVIDTAALYPHPEGLPKRRPLRLVTQKVLGRFIQQGTQGHDSKEDAKACIDIVKKFLEKAHTCNTFTEHSLVHTTIIA